MKLHSLRLILDGSDIAYKIFTKDQPEKSRLSFESFQTLHLQGKKILESKWGGLSSQEIEQAMNTALVIRDLGKSEKARELFSPYGAKAPDHGDFHAEVIQVLEKHPELCPSFVKLPLAARKLLLKTINLHISHIELNANMFCKLQKNITASTDPIALSFDLFVHTCDVAGTLGHLNNQSSLVYTEPTHITMKALEDGIWELTSSKS